MRASACRNRCYSIKGSRFIVVVFLLFSTPSSEEPEGSPKQPDCFETYIVQKWVGILLLDVKVSRGIDLRRIARHNFTS
jgi:hypothetical protein